MADNNGGSGFLGLIAGLLIAVIVVVGGIYLFNGGFGERSTEVNIEVPNVEAPAVPNPG